MSKGGIKDIGLNACSLLVQQCPIKSSFNETASTSNNTGFYMQRLMIVNVLVSTKANINS